MEEQYTNIRFLIIPIEISNQINFDEVKETSLDTIRLSVDRTKTFVKYNINEGRPSVYSEEYPEYTYNEMFNILQTEEWFAEDDF